MDRDPLPSSQKTLSWNHTFIVLLDGGGNNPERVRSVLTKYATASNGHVSNLTPAAVAVIQIGDDLNATEFLNDLDLKPLDIVDS